MIELEEELALLDKYRITPNELVFIQTLLIFQQEDDYTLFKEYVEGLHNANISLFDILTSLVEKGIILSTFKVPHAGESFNPLELPFNKNIVKAIYKASFTMGEELFKSYPQFGSIEGKTIGLRSVSRKFDSLEDAYRRYGKAIGWNPEKHQHIIELLKWASEHNIINYSLASFIIDHRWEELEALHAGEGNINYDAVTLL